MGIVLLVFLVNRKPMISGRLGKRKINSEPIEDFLQREMRNSLSMGARRNDPLNHVHLKIAGVQIHDVRPKENLVLFNPDKIIEEANRVDPRAENEFLAKLPEVKAFITGLKSAAQGNANAGAGIANQGVSSLAPNSRPGQYTVREDDIQNFCRRFNTNRETAKFYLEMFQNYDLAVSNYMSDNGLESTANRPR
eukprot:TRINITY_DN316_c0_g4_i1.p1 TRINITY_DN316_c0_g4~~TRINITY_DN316_c0_g4_i1.p1  ORF type:complete len:194 (-),score=37.90 TRINITY_DN316_c0_g4_i1:197-778(-)